jgi:hypothetical protein
MSDIVYKTADARLITTCCDMSSIEVEKFVDGLNTSNKKNKFVGSVIELKHLTEQLEIHFDTSPYAWTVRPQPDGSLKGLYIGLLLSLKYEYIYSIAISPTILEHLTKMKLFDLKLLTGQVGG